MDFSIPEYVQNFGKQVENGKQMEHTVSIAGRIRTKRPSGSKLLFYDLVGDGAKVQIMASLSSSEHAADAEAFLKLHNGVKRGDIVGIMGHPGASKNGELSIFPTHMEVHPNNHTSRNLSLAGICHTAGTAEIRVPLCATSTKICLNLPTMLLPVPAPYHPHKPDLHSVPGTLQRRCSVAAIWAYRAILHTDAVPDSCFL